MIGYDLIIAFFVALILSLLLALVFGWERPGHAGVWPSLLFLFFIIFVAAWAGGVWIQPYGPVNWSVYWLPFLIVGILFALLLVAVVPPKRPRSRREAKQQAKEVAENDAALSFFFWVFLIALVIAAIVGYAV